MQKATKHNVIVKSVSDARVKRKTCVYHRPVIRLAAMFPQPLTTPPVCAPLRFLRQDDGEMPIKMVNDL
jgi:hypothetical protein